MKIYFTLAQVPEMAGLTRQKRKLVYQCALEALFAEQPAILWVCSRWLWGSLLGGVVVGMAAATHGFAHWDGLRSRLLVPIVLGLAGGLIGAFFGGQRITALLRPYFRRVLEERKDELDRIR